MVHLRKRRSVCASPAIYEKQRRYVWIWCAALQKKALYSPVWHCAIHSWRATARNPSIDSISRWLPRRSPTRSPAEKRTAAPFTGCSVPLWKRRTETCPSPCRCFTACRRREARNGRSASSGATDYCSPPRINALTVLYFRNCRLSRGTGKIVLFGQNGIVNASARETVQALVTGRSRLFLLQSGSAFRLDFFRKCTYPPKLPFRFLHHKFSLFSEIS